MPFLLVKKYTTRNWTNYGFINVIFEIPREGSDYKSVRKRILDDRGSINVS